MGHFFIRYLRFAWHLARREHDVIFNGNPDRKSDSISFTGHRPSPPNTTIHVAVTVPFVSFESHKSRFREVLWDGTYEICSLPRRLECLPYYLQIRNKATDPTKPQVLVQAYRSEVWCSTGWANQSVVKMLCANLPIFLVHFALRHVLRSSKREWKNSKKNWRNKKTRNRRC